MNREKREKRGDRERGEKRGRGGWIEIQCREGEDSKTTIFSSSKGRDVVVDLKPCGDCGFYWEAGDDKDSIFVPHTHVFCDVTVITLTCSGSGTCACEYRIREVSKP